MTIHALTAKRCDAVLELHPDVMTGERWESLPNYAEYRAWLRETTLPVWMHEPDGLIPASVAYPRREIEERFMGGMRLGSRPVESFFGGTASYGIALALHLGFERIELYGVELNSRPDYDDERDCLFYWTGLANGLGVPVIAHEESRLFRRKLYPME